MKIPPPRAVGGGIFDSDIQQTDAAGFTAPANDFRRGYWRRRHQIDRTVGRICVYDTYTFAEYDNEFPEPEPWPAQEPDDFLLFDSKRDYLTQLDDYHEWQRR